jgi:hypothetical protein
VSCPETINGEPVPEHVRAFVHRLEAEHGEARAWWLLEAFQDACAACGISWGEDRRPWTDEDDACILAYINSRRHEMPPANE